MPVPRTHYVPGTVPSMEDIGRKEEVLPCPQGAPSLTQVPLDEEKETVLSNASTLEGRVFIETYNLGSQRSQGFVGVFCQYRSVSNVEERCSGEKLEAGRP